MNICTCPQNNIFFGVCALLLNLPLGVKYSIYIEHSLRTPRHTLQKLITKDTIENKKK